MSPSSHAELPVAEIAERLAAAVARSPADETSIAWIDTRCGRVVAGDGAQEKATEAAGDGGLSGSRVSVELRVRERGRVGHHRSGALDAGGLDAAVRQALGLARLRPEAPPLPLPGPADAEEGEGLHDPAIAGLAAAAARQMLAAGRRDGETMRLDWHVLHLAVANSRGLVRGIAATSATLGVRVGGTGSGAGAGYAAGSARSLAALAAPRIVERARRRVVEGVGTEEAAAEPATLDGVPLLLSAEAGAALVALFARTALSSRAVLDGVSFLADRWGQRLFAPAFTLIDDGTDADGLPFRCDVDGWPKRPVTLVDAGSAASPALDPDLGRRLGRTPTPHAVAADESRPGHLFVATGEADEAALLAAADGGFAVSRLASLVCHEPTRGGFRATVRGVRRIEGGALATPLADLVWVSDLERLFADLQAVGSERVKLALDGAWGGVTVPAMVIAPSTG